MVQEVRVEPIRIERLLGFRSSDPLLCGITCAIGQEVCTCRERACYQSGVKLPPPVDELVPFPRGNPALLATAPDVTELAV